jgi:hypothetical protein
VKTILNETLQSGSYTVMSDIRDLPSGHYIYQLRSGDFLKSLPLTVIKR